MIIIGSVINRNSHLREKAIVVGRNGSYQTSLATARSRGLRELYRYREDSTAYHVFAEND